jgi:hypothetical protein
MREVFRDAERRGSEPVLLFTGDLIHGPDCEPEQWPEFLGSHYVDQSGAVLEEFIMLQREFPSRVFCLLGNHEHSHVGGPHTPKFWPDETAHFEAVVGPRKTERYKVLFGSLPLVAVAECGLVMTHAAPNVKMNGPEDIEQLGYEGYEDLGIWSMAEIPFLGGLLWSRSCPTAVSRRFLTSLSGGGLRLTVVVFGHEIVAEGYDRMGEDQLVLSTSFGVADERKFYLRADLGGRYESVHALREGAELRRLY